MAKGRAKKSKTKSESTELEQSPKEIKRDVFRVHMEGSEQFINMIISGTTLSEVLSIVKSADSKGKEAIQRGGFSFHVSITKSGIHITEDGVA